MRVIVHAGFHKTGTTSVQQALRLNRAALKPHLRIVLRPAMVAVCEAARGYSAVPDAVNLALFQYELAQLAETWPARDSRPVLLASEDLSGHMPGRKGVKTYQGAPRLMAALVETLRRIHPGAAPEFYFSTRRTDDWLRSCHAQHLCASRLTLDAAKYAKAYRRSANLDAIIDNVAKATACPTHRAALEQGDPLAALLDVIGLPDELRARLRPADPANTAPPAEVLAALLDLNRGDMSEPDLRAAKRALLGRPR